MAPIPEVAVSPTPAGWLPELQPHQSLGHHSLAVPGTTFRPEEKARVQGFHRSFYAPGFSWPSLHLKATTISTMTPEVPWSSPGIWQACKNTAVPSKAVNVLYSKKLLTALSSLPRTRDRDLVPQTQALGFPVIDTAQRILFLYDCPHE